jgi:hypothetical protein
MQPESRTLVNIDTILFDSGPQDRSWSLTLVGRSVQVRANPTLWIWATGDGTELSSSRPGRPYPSSDVAHRYRRAGEYTLTVTTTWNGEFSVEGGPWQPIDGTVTRFASLPLEVVQARPQLVDGTRR